MRYFFYNHKIMSKFANITNYLLLEFRKNLNFNPDLFERINNMKHRYTLIVTGSIGVGKSTVLELLKYVLQEGITNLKVYPEFISTPIGDQLFKELNHSVSPFTLQSYILDCWKYLLIQNEYTNSNSFNLFERLPYDSVYCFAKQSLPDSKYKILKLDYEKLKKDTGIIEYKDCEGKDSNIINNNSIETVNLILGIIYNDILANKYNRVINLTIDQYENENRIKFRARGNEHFKEEVANYYKSKQLN